MISGDLPPTGSRVVFTNRDGNAVDTNAVHTMSPLQFPGYQSYWVQSGTAALALALIIARRQCPDVLSPSVLLPAYGCPDLVAAAEFAGCRPILVDIGANDPGYKLDQLAQALDDTTVAVVAVNFLGIGERLPQIRDLLTGHPHVLLIEDDAQWFPESETSLPAGVELHGDCVCLSFGRGKPVSLIGGGVMLIRDALVQDISELVDAPQSVGATLRLKAHVFNLLLHPHLYWLVNRNPFIKLGQTVFKPLLQIRALDTLRLRSLPSAATDYLRRSRMIEEAWAKAFSNLPRVKNITVTKDRCGRLLRYPILCRDIDERNRLWRMLDRAGLGVTAMYQCALPDVAGVGNKVEVFRDYAGAREFAARLLTLPVHADVTLKAVKKAAAIVCETNNESEA
jgi:dTDP-4-amino-4,6-dideoxygalactose transaminase